MASAIALVSAGRNAARATPSPASSAERAVRVVAFHNADFDGGRILNGRDAIVEHVAGDEQTVVIGGLLAHGLPHAHPDRALHLALDREPVERLAAVMGDPDLVHVDDTPVSSSTLTSTTCAE